MQETLQWNKVGFKLMKNLQKRSSTGLKKIVATVPQYKSIVYDCILDESKTIDAPDIKIDILDRYTAAYHKLIKEKPQVFHKKKLNFSHFVDISRPERELSKSKSPRNNDRELPKIWSRNCVVQHLSSKGENIADALNYKTQEEGRMQRKNIERSISPVENFLMKRKKKSMTENSFLNKKMVSINHMKNRDKHNNSVQEASARVLNQKHDSFNVLEYADSNGENIKIQNRIKAQVNKNLVNGDEKCLKSLKILLKKTNKIYKLNKLPFENNISNGNDPILNPYIID